MPQRFEIHYQEGDRLVRYLATTSEPVLIDQCKTGWLAVDSLELWDEREGECVTLEPGTGKRMGPTRLRVDRILRACEVGNTEVPRVAQRSERALSLRRKLETFFGRTLEDAVILHDTAPESEYVNYDLALEDFARREAESVECIGFESQMHRVNAKILHEVVAEVGAEASVKIQPPKRALLPVSFEEKRLCATECVYLLVTSWGKIAISIGKADVFDLGKLEIEILAFDEDCLIPILNDIDATVDRVNVFRGEVITLGGDAQESAAIRFADISFPSADELVLPDGVLNLVERQTLAPRKHRLKLVDEDLSTSRGILLHGPPGTGKTLTVRYLLGRFDDHTRILISGSSMGAVGAAYRLASTLSPAVVVLEDVDLIGGERTGNAFVPFLHDLLDAMDGLERSADVTTILTTNRPDLLESALAQRPGRVDQAVEVALPGPRERLLLLRRFSRTFPIDADLRDYVQPTDGATGAFIEEFLRRARILSHEDSAPSVRRPHLDAALAELLDSNDSMTGSIVGFRPGGDLDAGMAEGDSPERSHLPI